MKCPHCLESFHHVWRATQLAPDRHAQWVIQQTTCPECGKSVMRFLEQNLQGVTLRTFTVHPKGVARPPLSLEVPYSFASAYKEAALVLSDSDRASAALSQRCLQDLLREKAGVKHTHLAHEIQQVIDSNQLPSYLADAIDSVRAIGNFASHPIKSKNSGAVIDVETGEAEWLLDTLEGLFDFYFRQPAELQKKRDAIDEKLTEAGKPPLKKQQP